MAKDDVDVKAFKKAQKEEKRAKRKATRSQMWQAFKMLKGRDKKLIPYMLLALLVPIIIFVGLGLLFGGFWAWTMPIFGILFGLMAGMWTFSRRLQNNFYSEAEGQAGAAAWALDNLRSGVGVVWHTKNAVSANQQMDAVHRVVGNPGIVLVGEGDSRRVKQMMAKEKKALARIVGDTPIYELMVGSGEGEIPVKSIQRELLRFPRNYNKTQANSLNTKIETMDRNREMRSQLPGGPVPKGGGNMSGMNRRARRASDRSQGRG